jgi:hypothetical protein
MDLYRLDPPSWNDGLPNRLSAAVATAKVRAADKGCPVIVSRIDGRTLRVRAIRTVYSNGDVRAIR